VTTFVSGAKGVGTTTICGRLAPDEVVVLVPPVCDPLEEPPVVMTGLDVGAGVDVGLGVDVGAGVGVGVLPPPLLPWLPAPVGLGVAVGVAVGEGVGVGQRGWW
jgi:hypothetical protein